MLLRSAKHMSEGTFATDASAEQTAGEPEQPMIPPTMAALMILIVY